jgi:hypothetical protein
MLARRGLGEPQAGADAGAAERTGAAADDGQHRGDRDRGVAAGRGGKDQPADAASGDTGQGGARRRPAPAQRGGARALPPAILGRLGPRRGRRIGRGGHPGRWRSRRGRRDVVVLLDHVGADELVAVARHGADEARLLRVVAERVPHGPHGLAEGALRHDDVGPDAVEDLAAVHRLVTALDQQQEKIEVAGDERHVPPVPDEEPPTRRQGELTEAVASPAHGRGHFTHSPAGRAV